jgi:hypothetical protein
MLADSPKASTSPRATAHESPRSRDADRAAFLAAFWDWSASVSVFGTVSAFSGSQAEGRDGIGEILGVGEWFDGR